MERKNYNSAQKLCKLPAMLREFKRGSEPAFVYLYNGSKNILARYIKRTVNDDEVAIEILQDVYLRFWLHRESIDLKKCHLAFLFTIARNLVYDHRRKLNADRRKIKYFAAESTDLHNPTMEGILAKELDEILSKAVESLPNQCKKVYSLDRLEGKSHKEIGALLDISASTVNNQLVIANRKVRSFVSRYEKMSAPCSTKNKQKEQRA